MAKEKRSWFSKIFGSNNTNAPVTATEMTVLDGSRPVFTSYKGDFQNDSDIIACVDAIARNGAKMHPKHVQHRDDKTIYLTDKIYKLIANRPNELQNAYQFYYYVIYNLELYNDAFIYIQKDKDLKVTGLYPLDFSEGRLYEHKGKIWLKFRFGRGKERYVPYDDCIHLSRFTDKSGLTGGSTIPIIKTLSMKHVIDEGVINAIKTTQSIKGVIKSNKTILKSEDVKKMRDQFVRDFLSSDNTSGIGGLDGATDFTPVKIDPKTATDSQIKSINDKVLAYFGINENIIQSKYSEDEWNAFYESVLEPIGLQMGLEFTNKIFTPYQSFFGHEIIFESNRLQYASNNTKISLLRYATNLLMVDELREILNLAPLPNGEGQKVLQDLNHIDSTIANEYQAGESDNETGNEPNNSVKGGESDEEGS